MNAYNNNTRVSFAFFTKNQNVHEAPKYSQKTPLEKICNTFSLFHYLCHSELRLCTWLQSQHRALQW